MNDDRPRFSMSDEAKLAAWNETVRRMKEAQARCAELEAELSATRANLADVAATLYGAYSPALAAPPGMQERVAERLGLDAEPTQCECTVCEGNIGRCERPATRTVDGRRFCDGCGPGSFARNAMRGASTEDIQAELKRRLAEALERIAAWFDDEGCNGEAAIDLRAFASGGRPLPGGKP